MYIPPTRTPAVAAAESLAQFGGKIENVKVLVVKTLHFMLATFAVFPVKTLHDMLTRLAVLAAILDEFIKTLEKGSPITTLVAFMATFVVGLPASPIDKADSDE